MDELIGWLLAQLDEDRDDAQDAIERPDGGQYSAGSPSLEWVLADIEAKRALIEETIRPYLGNGQTTGRIAEQSLRLMCWGYRHRDGYRPDWSPQ